MESFKNICIFLFFGVQVTFFSSCTKLIIDSAHCNKRDVFIENTPTNNAKMFLDSLGVEYHFFMEYCYKPLYGRSEGVWNDINKLNVPCKVYEKPIQILKNKKRNIKKDFIFSYIDTSINAELRFSHYFGGSFDPYKIKRINKKEDVLFTPECIADLSERIIFSIWGSKVNKIPSKSLEYPIEYYKLYFHDFNDIISKKYYPSLYEDGELPSEESSMV